MIIIVGGGMSGLSCALKLEQAGVDWLLLESSEKLGGRVATETTAEGYRVDAGFQVLLDSYPTPQKLLDFAALEPRYFQSGALMVRSNGEIERFLNPLIHHDWAGGACCSAAFSWSEKLSLLSHAAIQICRSDRDLLSRENGYSIMQEIRSLGLEGSMLRRFLHPFFAGVFLDQKLENDSSTFRYYLKKFALGRALLPARGMGAIPDQLASRLPSNRIRLNARVEKLHRVEDRFSAIELAPEGSGKGETISCDQIVLATDERNTRSLLGLPDGRMWRGVTTLYFTGDTPLYEGSLIVLPELLEGRNRLVAHFTDLANVSPEYAPSGKRLLSATVLASPAAIDQGELATLAHKELSALFPTFESWKFLKSVVIPHALPKRLSGFQKEKLPVRFSSNLFLAGDQVSAVSIESSLASGEMVAEELLSGH